MGAVGGCSTKKDCATSCGSKSEASMGAVSGKSGCGEKKSGCGSAKSGCGSKA
jgi:hypothetical protein